MINISGRQNAAFNTSFLFVFFATKAIHVELDGDMTTALFIDALRPFCDTRHLL